MHTYTRFYPTCIVKLYLTEKYLKYFLKNWFYEWLCEYFSVVLSWFGFWKTFRKLLHSLFSKIELQHNLVKLFYFCILFSAIEFFFKWNRVILLILRNLAIHLWSKFTDKLLRFLQTCWDQNCETFKDPPSPLFFVGECKAELLYAYI